MTNKNFRVFLLFFAATFSILSDASDSPSLFVVHFETGPAWQQGIAPNEQTGFARHAQNLQTLRKAGTIQFGARYEQYGMVFLRASSLQDATAVLEADPGVKSGLFIYRVAKMNVFYPWQETTDIKR